MLEIALAGVIGYLLGSIPTGVLVSKAWGAPDVRWSGSGHTGGTNVLRTAGPLPAVLTAVGDVLLGVGAVSIALLLTDNPWAPTVAGIMATVGHNWSVFIGFRGGVGLSKLWGGILRLWPGPALVAFVVLPILYFVVSRLLRIHRARATILLTPSLGLLLWLLKVPWPGVVLALLGGVAVIVKTLPDWNRKYD